MELQIYHHRSALVTSDTELRHETLSENLL